MMRLKRPGSGFPDPVKRELLDRSGGICECHLVPQLPTFGVGCGALLGPGNTFLEHIVPRELGGRDDLSNGAALVKTCWKVKTAAYDLPAIADAKRQQDRQFGIGGPGQGRSPMRGGRFSPESRSIDGRVKPRRSLTIKLVDAGIVHPDALRAAMAEDPAVCLVVTHPHPQPVTE